MHRAKEIDITNEISNEEHTDQFGLSLMNKRSEIKFPKPSRTEIFPSLCLFFNQSRKKSIEQILVNVETNEFEKQVRKFIVWMEDSKVLARITGANLPAEEVKFYAYCIIKY